MMICGLEAAPDIRTVKADLVLPPLSKGAPAVGKRVKQTHSDWRDTKVYHVLFLPRDWKPEAKLPVIVEFAGNGPYRSRFGDVSTGNPEGSKMGFGISGGNGFIWVCLPYLNNAGTHNVTQWWGDAPKYDVRPTVEYCKKTVPWICKQYGGDPGRVILCGFSRGAIACNFVGLHDDAIAKLWRAFVPYSHYDGVNERWGYPGADRKSALVRLKRLGDRPQFICHEGNGIVATRRWVETTGIKSPIAFRPTGFRNHNDAWLLRPSPSRRALRHWLSSTLAN
jgi:hypothetical protein